MYLDRLKLNRGMQIPRTSTRGKTRKIAETMSGPKMPCKLAHLTHDLSFLEVESDLEEGRPLFTLSMVLLVLRVSIKGQDLSLQKDAYLTTSMKLDQVTIMYPLTQQL